MDWFRRNDVQRLSALDNTWCVTLCLPTHRTGTELQQDPIRFKNLLRDAERQLLAAGLRAPVAEAILEPGTKLLADHQFWQHQSDGLAVFLADQFSATYRVPLAMPELATVAQRFQLKPLFPLLTGDGLFHILAVSQNAVRLIRATRHSADELVVENLPRNFEEALGLDEQQSQLHFHTGASPRGGQRAAMFHGQGPGDELTKEQLATYFRRIDDALSPVLNGSGAPLVLAGVEYYLPILREVTRYSLLMPTGLPGNPDTLRPADLQSRGWPLVESWFQKAQQNCLDKFHQALGTGLSSTNLEEILPAAAQGRVETLFVATDRQIWGTFNSQALTLERQENSSPLNEDLTDRAAIETHLTRGTVYALPAASMPSEEPLAAVFRF